MEVAKLPWEASSCAKGDLKEEEEGLLDHHLGPGPRASSYKRGNVRGLMRHRESLLKDARAFLSLEDDPAEDLDREEADAYRRSHTPWAILHRSELCQKPATVARKLDLSASLVLLFMAQLMPWWLLGVLTYSIAYTFNKAGTLADMMSLHRVFGIVVSITVAFKNNAAYDRWRSAKKTVQQLLGFGRDLVLEAYSALPKEGDHDPARTARMRGACMEIRRRTNLFFAFARQSIRESVKGFMPGSTVQDVPFDRETFVLDPVLPRVRDLLNSKERMRFAAMPPARRPAVVAGELKALVQALGEDVLSPSEYRRYSHQYIRGMLECLDSILRTRDNPIVRNYDWIMNATIFVMVYVTPFIYERGGIGAKWSFPALFVLIATELLVLAFFGVALIGKQLQNPYGYGLSDLALEETCFKLHKDTLMISTALGDDSHHYIPDDAFTEVPFKIGYFEAAYHRLKALRGACGGKANGKGKERVKRQRTLQRKESMDEEVGW